MKIMLNFIGIIYYAIYGMEEFAWNAQKEVSLTIMEYAELQIIIVEHGIGLMGYA